MPPNAGGDALQKVDELDIGALVVSTATSVVKNRPIGVSMWVIGLLLAAFAKGFAVDEATREQYSITLQHAQDVSSKELNDAYRNFQTADQRYRNAKGWFWSCDARCNKAYDQMTMARAEVDRVERKRDAIVQDARREVGIWSSFGVQDVRDTFWASWKSGKDFAARYTMMDAMFMAIGGREEQTLVQMILQLVFQYIINLTMGLIGAFFFFIYSLYSLICAYGEPALSGIAFFLLVLVASMATVGTYLIAIYGTVAGGGLYIVKQAAKQAKLEGERGGQRQRPRQVQYGGNPYAQRRSHYD